MWARQAPHILYQQDLLDNKQHNSAGKTSDSQANRCTTECWQEQRCVWFTSRHATGGQGHPHPLPPPPAPPSTHAAGGGGGGENHTHATRPCFNPLKYPSAGGVGTSIYSRRRNISALPAKVTQLPRDLFFKSNDLEMNSFR